MFPPDVKEQQMNFWHPSTRFFSGRVTMSTAGLQAANKQNAKELDNMKESISDIINQLQDIDPTRLSFSPFLDLDTQISLAPVSDSPESSVEELHSSSHSFSGSQHSLEESPATGRTRGELLLYFLLSDGENIQNKRLPWREFRWNQDYKSIVLFPHERQDLESNQEWIQGLNPFVLHYFHSEPTTAAGSCSLSLATGCLINSHVY